MTNETRGRDDAPRNGTTARWISDGLEVLLRELSDKPQRDQYDFDFVIVGSGYGGALSALKLAGSTDHNGKTPSVCVLERGREYLSGMFPSSEGELPGHVRFNTPDGKKARGRTDALLDLRIGKDVSALVANGLGGGSLINAGVMLKPTPAVLQSERWPKALRSPSALDDYYAEAQRILSANACTFQTFADAKVPTPLKFTALKELGGADFRPAPLSMALEASTNQAGVRLEECKRCGDCATGCNHRAKNSLDQNCLALAQRRGARLFTGANVLRVERLTDAPGWAVLVTHTSPNLQEQEQRPFRLTARRVMLAAGTYGSTEILLRSRGNTLRFSMQLGSRFSGNGDLLAAVYGQRRRINSVALESTPFGSREVGPSVTGVIDRRDVNVAIQEFSIPGALRRLFAESFATAHMFHSLATNDRSRHEPPRDGMDPCGVNPHVVDHTQIVGLIGDDGARGQLELVPDSEAGQGAIRVAWPKLREGPDGDVFSNQMRTLKDLVQRADQGGAVLPNPIWRIIPEELQSLVDIPRGPSITVHPLGGCGMGDDWSSGVVDDCGRVFDRNARGEVHDDLVVLDGSVIPCALAINPSLTIAAVTLRALEHLCKQWMLTPHADAPPQPAALPVFREPKVVAREPATIAVLERVAGDVRLALDGRGAKPYHVELTLAFRPFDLERLATDMQRTLTVEPANSTIRIFDRDVWHELSRTGASEGRFEQGALFTGSLEGQLSLLQRKQTTRFGRIARALWAFVLNRGLRDYWQRYIAADADERRRRNTSSLWSHFKALLNVANHAGTVRLFDYDLEIVPGATHRTATSFDRQLFGKKVQARKTLAYRVGSNPWKQLSEVAVRRFPRRPWLRAFWKSPTLELDGKFFADRNAHLLRLDSQRDHATALFEVASFVLMIARAVFTTHFWSFRKPDRAEPRTPERLPGKIAGLPDPTTTELSLRTCVVNQASLRLTHYARRDGLPIVLIHGFSANGTSFTHPSLGKNSLAQYLWETGRDIWILDLRTSSGLPSCESEWTFEEVAREDIPKALAFVREATGKPVDVFAHCMGAAMFSMALLDPQVGKRVRSSIGKVILSQIGPMITFSPANVFRAYAVSYIEHAFGNVTFKMQPEDGLGSHLLDRMLATVCYPEDEFRIENPRTPWKRTPFVGTRHRMDAWFGCVFKLSNVDRAVLEHIDDMFGDINLRTTFQTIHFARMGMITTRDGRNEFVHRANLQNWRGVPTLSIHGDENRLADPATVTHLHALMRSVNPLYRSYRARGFGHQDCIIGRDAPRAIFPEIDAFLRDPEHYRAGPRCTEHEPGTFTRSIRRPTSIVRIPWIGPVRDTAVGDSFVVAADPKLGTPAAILAVPVARSATRDRYALVANAPVASLGYTPAQPHHASANMHAVMQDATALYSLVCTSLPQQDTDPAVLILIVYDSPAAQARYAFAAVTDFGTLGPSQLREDIQQYLSETPAQEIDHAVLDRRPREPMSDRVRFVFASCQYPAGPLDPALASRSYTKLDALLSDPGSSPDFVLLTGDQVYTDATAGLMDASKSDDEYRRPYEEWLRTPAVRSVLKRVPVFTMLDDHEIRDNWHPLLDDVDIEAAKAAYLKFQRAAGPSCGAVMPGGGVPLWYTLPRPYDVSFFVADTRTERDARAARAIGTAEIMSERQMTTLQQWLCANRHDGRPLFVSSPSVFLPRRSPTARAAKDPACALRSDAWDGFPKSLHTLLAWIADKEIHNVVFLSGDEHHSFAARATLRKLDTEGRAIPGSDIVVHSIHSSGLYSPYTFANGLPEELAMEEAFEEFDFVANGKRYQCEVRVDALAPGDGFTEIGCQRRESEWTLSCAFHKAADSDPIRHEIRLDATTRLPVRPDETCDDTLSGIPALDQAEALVTQRTDVETRH